MTVRYEPNLAYEPPLEAQANFRKGMKDRAKVAAASVRTVAPKHTGYYARHVKAVGNEVWATDPFWHIVEWGSVNSAPYRPMTLGVRATGMRFVPLPKHS